MICPKGIRLALFLIKFFYLIIWRAKDNMIWHNICDILRLIGTVYETSTALYHTVIILPSPPTPHFLETSPAPPITYKIQFIHILDIRNGNLKISSSVWLCDIPLPHPLGANQYNTQHCGRLDICAIPEMSYVV